MTSQGTTFCTAESSQDVAHCSAAAAKCPNLLRMTSDFAAVVGRAFARHMMPLIVSPCRQYWAPRTFAWRCASGRKTGILYPLTSQQFISVAKRGAPCTGLGAEHQVEGSCDADYSAQRRNCSPASQEGYYEDHRIPVCCTIKGAELFHLPIMRK